MVELTQQNIIEFIQQPNQVTKDQLSLLNELSNEQLTTFAPSAASLIPKIDIIEQNLTLVLKELEK